MSKVLKLTMESLLHLLVDFMCLYSVLEATLKTENTIAIIVLYNIIAFGTQIIFGYIIDKKNYKYMGIVGVYFTIASSLMLLKTENVQQLIYIFTVMIGLGNSLFHVGTGIDVIKSAKGKLTDLGIFISTGTIGVFLGRYCSLHIHMELDKYVAIAIGIGLIASIYGKYIENKETYENETIKFNIHNAEYTKHMIIYVTFICVIARSLTGWISAEFSMAGTWLLVPILVFIGKFTGGILADKIGARDIALLAMLISIIANIVGAITGMPLAIAGILFSNMLMAITLGVLVSVLKEYPGTAFGITTLALLIGTLPTFVMGKIQNTFIDTLIYTIAGIGILITVTRGKKEHADNTD